MEDNQIPVEENPVSGEETFSPLEEQKIIENSVVMQVSAVQINVENSLVGAAAAESDLSVTDSAGGAFAAGRDLTFHDGGGMVFVAGGDLALSDGGGLLMVAGGEAKIENGGAALLIAGGPVTLEGDSKVLMTTEQALAFGAAFGAVFTVFSFLLRRRR